jgi:hypothetical protein
MLVITTSNLTQAFSGYFAVNNSTASQNWGNFRATELSMTKSKQTPWPYSASELYRPRDRRLSAKLVPTLADRGCRVVSSTDPHGRILGFLDRSRYYFFQVAPQLYSRGWVGPVPDPVLLRKSGSAGNRTRDLWICSQKLWPLDHRGGLTVTKSVIVIETPSSTASVFGVCCNFSELRKLSSNRTYCD